MKKSPVIGFPLDHEEGGGYSKLPWYALRENYFTAVSSLGAVPLGLPYVLDAVETYLDMIDGLIITGGAFDVSPELYGASPQHETVTTKNARTQFEFAITRGAIARGMPVLGICGGEQLLNVVLGGTLIQHIPDSVENCLEHEQKNPRNEPGHVVDIVEGTLLHRIVSTLSPWERGGASLGEGLSNAEKSPHPSPLPEGEGITMNVNTAHHQAVDTPAPGVIVSARSSDGVIEAIEYPAHPFCLGVQWHPEYHVDAGDKKIFEAFVGACQLR